MKKGFYDQKEQLQQTYPDADFDFLRDVKVTERFSAFKYLHGLCADFAATLSDVYGYPIETVRHWEEPNIDGHLIHAYCVDEHLGETVFIDIRGMTTNPVLFYNEFANEVTYFADEEYELWDLEGPAKVEFWEGKNDLFDGDYEGWADEEIKRFIEAHDQYYNVSKFSRK